MRLPKLAALIGTILLLTGCAGNRIDSYGGTYPPMKFDEFFNGPVKGYGIVQDRHGKIIKRFDVDMLGKWNGNDGELIEHFVYYDGKIQDRTWKIHKIADDRYVGRADDIVGDAPGQSKGSAIQWNYTMTVDANGRKVDLQFDDWMYLMHDDLVINRSYMSKFGVRVAELSIVMQKQHPRKAARSR